MNKLLTYLTKLTNPHLNRIMRSNRPVSQDWRLTLDQAPAVLPFDIGRGSSNSSSGRSKGRIGFDEDESQALDLRRPYRILCLDGGGIKGVITTKLLQRICRDNPKFLDSVDLICGTSAGGLLALLLSCGYDADECDAIYSYAGPHIFSHNPWRVLNPFKAKYSDKPKQEILQYYCGNRTMADLQKTCAVVAFRLDGRRSSTHKLFNRDGWRPAVFSNMPKAGSMIRPDSDLKVWDAGMRTSAAPTFFPVFRGYTDGGIVANNPSMIAVSKAMAHYPHVNSKNVAVLSIGAGQYPRHTKMIENWQKRQSKQSASHFAADTEAQEDMSSPLWRADWGIQQWVPYMLDILLDGDCITTELVAHYLLAGSGMYHRLDPQLPRWIALDEIPAIEELQHAAEAVDLTQTNKFINDCFVFDDTDFDNAVHNSLDSSSHYHDAWHSTVSRNTAAPAAMV